MNPRDMKFRVKGPCKLPGDVPLTNMWRVRSVWMKLRYGTLNSVQLLSGYQFQKAYLTPCLCLWCYMTKLNSRALRKHQRRTLCFRQVTLKGHRFLFPSHEKRPAELGHPSYRHQLLPTVYVGNKVTSNNTINRIENIRWVQWTNFIGLQNSCFVNLEVQPRHFH